MPPEQITNVSPTASSSTSVPVLEVFSQFARVRKYGESMLNATMSASSTPPIHKSRITAWPRSSSRRCAGAVAASASVLTPAITAPSLPSPR